MYKYTTDIVIFLHQLCKQNKNMAMEMLIHLLLLHGFPGMTNGRGESGEWAYINLVSGRGIYVVRQVIISLVIEAL